MKSSKKKKLEKFYDINNKRDSIKIMKSQTDLEFQQNEIKKLNKNYNVEMFSTRLHEGKAFAAEQKIRELKKLLLKSKFLEERSKKT